jgi:hypothetical protein
VEGHHVAHFQETHSSHSDQCSASRCLGRGLPCRTGQIFRESADGLGFSDFKGYESWQTIGVSQSGDLIEVILGDPAMIAAYQTGLPATGKHFPDGVRMAKIHWKAKKSEDAPSPTTVHGELDDVDFMMKDSKRFADSGGWGYAQFNWAPATKAFTPLGTGYKCGTACHTLVKAKDLPGTF